MFSKLLNDIRISFRRLSNNSEKDLSLWPCTVVSQRPLIIFCMKKDLKKFISEKKSELEAEKIRLETELSKFAHRNTKSTETDYSADFPDIGDKEDENASEVAEYSNNLSLEDELEKALRDVEDTLKRMGEDDYGVCKYCNQEIDHRRLEARPTSSSCIQCKKTLTQEV